VDYVLFIGFCQVQLFYPLFSFISSQTQFLNPWF